MIPRSIYSRNKKKKNKHQKISKGMVGDGGEISKVQNQRKYQGGWVAAQEADLPARPIDSGQLVTSGSAAKEKRSGNGIGEGKKQGGKQCWSLISNPGWGRGQD